jgi:SAM-dependent methyltransferase
MNSDVIKANQYVHSSLILSGEYQKSPHRGAESVRRVRAVLAGFLSSEQKISHLDVGCGDGFIFECRPAHWTSHGIDATPEMLNACAENHPEVKLKEGCAEALAFDDASFDVVTCYSFLDHLEFTERFYSEAIRILRPGGVFYFGLSPNRGFYVELERTRQFNLSGLLTSNVDMSLEFKKAFDDGSYYEDNFGIAKEDLVRCEPGKSISHGLSPTEERAKLERLGVSEIKVEYEWVFQQNRHNPNVIKTLKDFLPFSSSCFKYFDLSGIK